MSSSKPKYKNQIDYLEQNGYLKSGTKEALAEGKKAWRRYYKKEHRKAAKERRPEVVVIFPSVELYKRIKSQAAAHRRSLSRFMWECVSTYLEQKYLQVQPKIWEDIHQNVELTRLVIQKINEDVEDGTLPKSYAHNLLLEKLMELQEVLEQHLNEPKLLHQAIETLLSKEPWQKQKLLDLIQSI